MNNSCKLVQSVKNFDQSFKKIASDEEKLMRIRDEFVSNINSMVDFSSDGLQKENDLFEAGKVMEKSIAEAVRNWASEWEARKATRELSEKFQDKVIFLVFGKVNAGKSSFCNYVASLFPEEGKRFFYLDKGEIRNTQEEFKEGVTETTSRIQGVELGHKLVLLDSPGLHSVTEENGELTRRFTDSADAILWLTSSASPGQVQELDDLQEELEKGKPLLPIITKSDVLEEDCDESGNLISTLRNKTPENRKLQEEDVFSRTKEKLSEKREDKVRKPLSISVHAYKNNIDQENSFQESGLAELDERMASLVNEASEYKPGKARRQVINYLDDSVCKSIEKTLKPNIDKIEETIENESRNLKRRKDEVLGKIQLELSKNINEWAEDLKGSRDTNQLAININNFIQEHLEAEIKQSVQRFAGKVDKILVNISESDIGKYKDKEVEIQEIRGHGKKSAAAAGAAGVGAVIGGFFGGPLGAAIGGTIGGFLGRSAGASFVETVTRTVTVGVDSTEVVSSTIDAVNKKLPKIIDTAFDPWDKVLNSAKSRVNKIKNEIENFNIKLQEAKESI